MVCGCQMGEQASKEEVRRKKNQGMEADVGVGVEATGQQVQLILHPSHSPVVVQSNQNSLD